MATLSTTSFPATSTLVLPEAALHVTGAARLVLVINLGSFVVAPDADVFRHLRGSEPFAALSIASTTRPTTTWRAAPWAPR